MTSDEKGIALEIAVHSIEEVILESSPSLRGQPFQVERRKRIVVGGVHHEIDVFVTVGAATGYEATFIFECKNWEDPVSKNDLIIFSEKISAAVAQRGYFVAKKFAKDALAQAAQNPKIPIANPHDPSPPIAMPAQPRVSTRPKAASGPKANPKGEKRQPDPGDHTGRDKPKGGTTTGDVTVQPGGVASFGQQGGITAGRVEVYNPAPPERNWKLSAKDCNQLVSKLGSTIAVKISVGAFISNDDGMQVVDQIASCIGRIPGWEGATTTAALPVNPVGEVRILGKDNNPTLVALESWLRGLRFNVRITPRDFEGIEIEVGRSPFIDTAGKLP